MCADHECICYDGEVYVENERLRADRDRLQGEVDAAITIAERAEHRANQAESELDAPREKVRGWADRLAQEQYGAVQREMREAVRDD